MPNLAYIEPHESGAARIVETASSNATRYMDGVTPAHWTDPTRITLAPDEVRGRTHYIPAPRWDGLEDFVERPEPPDLPSQAVAAGQPLGGFPSGAAVCVWKGELKALTRATVTPDGSLTFPSAGLWEVLIHEAWPVRERRFRIEVTP